MRLISILAVVLGCAACQSQPNLMAPAGPTTAVEPPANQPSCTSYTVPVTVGGQQEESVVESCPQPDGSWRITQNTPGLPLQVYVVPPPTQYPSGYPYLAARTHSEIRMRRKRDTELAHALREVELRTAAESAKESLAITHEATLGWQISARQYRAVGKRWYPAMRSQQP